MAPSAFSRWSSARPTKAFAWYHSTVSVQPSHLSNSSIKGDGVRIFLSTRDRPYRQDFHAPTKLLPETIQGPGRSEMPATWSNRFQCRHQPLHQCQRHSQMDTALPRATLPAFVQLLVHAYTDAPCTDSRTSDDRTRTKPLRTFIAPPPLASCSWS